MEPAPHSCSAHSMPDVVPGRSAALYKHGLALRASGVVRKEYSVL